VTLHLAVSFKQFGLSLIGDNGRQRCELLFLSLKQFGLIILEKKDLRTFQLKIKSISIENNSNHNTSNAVLLTPWKEQENHRSPRPFLVFLVEQGLKHKSITEIKSMRICLQPTSIRVDDEFLERLYGFVKMINSNGSTNIDQVNLAELVNDNVLFAWESSELNNLQSETFIQELEIAKISLIISFAMRPRDSSSNLLIYHILSSFGVALSKISESPITFSHIILHSRNLNQIKKELAESYRGQFIRGLYKILGSMNFIGNPYSLGRYFVEGLVEVVDNPVQGFIKGPIEGTFGIITGGVGLVRNVVAGTFNSFELIS
jgi:vacuolar protein sorting-associated protein 13A/C